MITLAEAVERAPLRQGVARLLQTLVRQPIIEPSARESEGIFTDDEERAIAKVEAVIDGKLRSGFDGGPIRLVFKEEISGLVAFEICRRYEQCGWRVTARSDAGPPPSTAFDFTPVYAALSKVQRSSALPPITLAQSIAPAAVHAGRRLLVRMPTRARPRQALEVLEKYRAMAGCPIAIEVVIDDDDEDMLACEVQQRLAALGCVVTVDHHRSKISACNAGRIEDWDILVLASDDMMPVRNGWAARVIAAMEEHFPHLDGAVFFDDGHQHENCVTLPILGRRLYRQFFVEE